MSVPIILCDGFDVRRYLIDKLNGEEEEEEDESVTEEEAVFTGEEEEQELCFYFVKQFAYDDPEIKAKIDEADNEIYRCNSDRIYIASTLKAKRAERLSLVASMESLVSSFDDNYSMGDQEVVTWKISGLSERLREIKMEIDLLDVQMGFVLGQRDKAVERIKMLRLQRDKGNAAFFQSRVVMKKALELAASGNVRDLEELANSEVEKFMSRWNNDKAFREDYKKRILPSLNERKLRRNGRIIHPEGDVDIENGNVTAEKKAVEFKSFSTEEGSDDVMDFDIPEYERLQKEEDDVMDFDIPEYEKLQKEEDDVMDFDIPESEKLQKEEEETDEETLKEKRRNEQLEKARLAMERKRKLHEKATARAAIRVKKEAEKKLKELEKRANKKKAASNTSSQSDLERTSETVTKVSEQEKTGKEKQQNGRSVNWKQRSFWYRHYKKGDESVPKAILKRRRAYRLWVWTVSSAALALPLAFLIAFIYIR